MSTFAVTNSDELLPAVNYLLSNLDTSGGQGNVVIPGNVLVANTTTGVVSQSGNSTVFGYLYQYVNLRYSNNATGTAGFSASSDNFEYFGVFNSAGSSPSNNPSAYQWYEVDPPFNSATSRTLYYSAIGGRQIQWAAASSPPSTSYQVTTANVAIDLDVVTTATGTPGDRGPIVMGYVITTADPGSATTATLTGWFEASRTALTPPIGTGLTPVVGDTAYFTYPATGASVTYEYNGSSWLSAVGQVVAGNVLVANTVSGNSLAQNTITGNKIANSTITGNLVLNGTLTGDKIQANTITATNIAAQTIVSSLIAANTILGNNIAGNTILATNIQSGTLTTNLFTANTISGNIITGGSITTDKLAANVLTANTVISTGATIGDFNSVGFWLQGNTGNARFGNTVSIGNNASIGGNLTVSGLITGGNLSLNTVQTNNIVSFSVTDTVFSDANPDPTQIVFINNANLYPNFTRGEAVPNGIALLPTTTSATQGSRILVNYQTYISSAVSSEYNLVELWKETTSYSSQYDFKHIFTAQPFGNTSINGTTSPIWSVGTNGGTVYSVNYGNTWTNASNANITTNWTATFGYANVRSSGGSYPGTYFFNKFNSAGVYYAGNVTVADASVLSNLGGVVNSSVNFTNNSNSTINDVILLTSGSTGGVDDSIPVASRPILYVGNSGAIYTTSGYLTGNTWNSNATAETSGVTTNLYAVGIDNYNEQGRYESSMNLVAVGAQGTILTNSRIYNASTGALVSTSGWTSRISGVTQDLNGIGYSPNETIWIIVGDTGTILRATTTTGTSWTKITSPVTANLNDVWSVLSQTTPGGSYNSYWIACGDGGVILVSTDAGLTWTSVSSPASDGSLNFLRNLNSITYTQETLPGILISGEGIIMKSYAPYTTWTVVYDAGFVQNPDLQRVEYYGSYANVFTTTQPSTIQRLGNNQVIAGTFIDSNFVADIPVKYYLYAGSLLANTAVYVQGSTLTATEFKR